MHELPGFYATPSFGEKSKSTILIAVTIYYASRIKKYVSDVKNPVFITQNGEAKAVLVDIETYQNTQNAFHLLKMLQMSEQEIEKGNCKPASVVFNTIATANTLLL